MCSSSPESSASISLYLAMSPQVESLISQAATLSTSPGITLVPMLLLQTLLHLNLCQAIFGKPLHSLLCEEMLSHATIPLESGEPTHVLEPGCLSRPSQHTWMETCASQMSTSTTDLLIQQPPTALAWPRFDAKFSAKSWPPCRTRKAPDKKSALVQPNVELDKTTSRFQSHSVASCNINRLTGSLSLSLRLSLSISPYLSLSLFPSVSRSIECNVNVKAKKMQTENNHQGVDDRKPHAAKSPLTKYVLFGEMGEQLLSTFSWQVMKLPRSQNQTKWEATLQFY